MPAANAASSRAGHGDLFVPRCLGGTAPGVGGCARGVGLDGARGMGLCSPSVGTIRFNCRPGVTVYAGDTTVNSLECAAFQLLHTA